MIATFIDTGSELIRIRASFILLGQLGLAIMLIITTVQQALRDTVIREYGAFGARLRYCQRRWSSRQLRGSRSKCGDQVGLREHPLFRRRQRANHANGPICWRTISLYSRSGKCANCLSGRRRRRRPFQTVFNDRKQQLEIIY